MFDFIIPTDETEAPHIIIFWSRTKIWADRIVPTNQSGILIRDRSAGPGLRTFQAK